MGWVGVGVLIATTGYFLYRYPPRSWTEPRSFAPSEPTPDAPPADKATNDSVQEKHGLEPSTPSIETEEEDLQATPKASASSAPISARAVPTFNLDSGESEPSQPAKMPFLSQTTKGTAAQSPATDRNDEASKSQPSPQPSLAPPPKPQQFTSSSTNNPSQPPLPNKHTPTPQTQRQLSRPATVSSSLSTRPGRAEQQQPSHQQHAIPDPSISQEILGSGDSCTRIFPLDWAQLAANPKNNLRGEGLPPGLLRVTPSMLKEQHGRKGRDAWTSYHGKVYNISPYAPYHPGGKGELLRGAGKDSAQLFQEIHPWVNWEGILGECLVGILVSEHDVQTENALDAMD
ncbi:uncharacterized protein N7515_006403 [Penicillium bovifimosum]|uniref:Cytochrome b5 heme-binding domain-containing protein n=1 Tax=Penicillium bovifimosum TaxID=126998 RepID=A0A9W9GUM2_9EURO|nr:uncharacterized protein N7515_006403 [Penicillium bovifimosum]KAJ5130364.1 hypothetical protein N7515_006403 [Penicillium bovifimosum]